MRSLLFHATSKGYPLDWKEFLREARELTLPEGAYQLAENVWVLPLPECQRFLEILKRLAGRKPLSIAVRTLEFDSEASWTRHQ